MSVIFTKDSLRASIEASSGGKMTVLYNDKGHPIYCAVVPKFNLQDVEPSGDLGTGTHPAFVVNGVEKDEIKYGLFPAVVRDGRAVCLPGVDPATNVDYDQAVAYCTANGPGWHLSTIFEWSAFKMWCLANGFQPRGNTDWGRHHDQLHETGVRPDGYSIGQSSGNGRTLTGSGPKSWRHDNSPFGVADLVGNVWEWQYLLKIVEGQIFLPGDNQFDLDEGSWPGLMAYFDSTASGTSSDSGDLGDPILASSVNNYLGPTGDDDNYGYAETPWTDMALVAGYFPPGQVTTAGISPKKDGDAGAIVSLFSGVLGNIWVRNYGERMPVAGGARSHGVKAGLSALDLGGARSRSSSTLGFRPAFISS